MQQLRRFNVGVAGEADCPVFDGLFEYCQVKELDELCEGCVLDLYRRLCGWCFDVESPQSGYLSQLGRSNNQSLEILSAEIGGMHHAKKAEAAGFCYINDIVLAILELLKVHLRRETPKSVF